MCNGYCICVLDICIYVLDICIYVTEEATCAREIVIVVLRISVQTSQTPTKHVFIQEYNFLGRDKQTPHPCLPDLS